MYDELLEVVANSVLVTEDMVILVEYSVELGYLPHNCKGGWWGASVHKE